VLADEIGQRPVSSPELERAAQYLHGELRKIPRLEVVSTPPSADGAGRSVTLRLWTHGWSTKAFAMHVVKVTI